LEKDNQELRNNLDEKRVFRSNNERELRRVVSDEINTNIKNSTRDLNKMNKTLSKAQSELNDFKKKDIGNKDEKLQSALDYKTKVEHAIKDLDDEIANLKENTRDSAAINDVERAVKDLHDELDNIKILLDREIQARSLADSARKIKKEKLLKMKQNYPKKTLHKTVFGLNQRGLFRLDQK